AARRARPFRALISIPCSLFSILCSLLLLPLFQELAVGDDAEDEHRRRLLAGLGCQAGEAAELAGLHLALEIQHGVVERGDETFEAAVGVDISGESAADHRQVCR